MLADQWLCDAERSDEFVHAPFRFAELEDDRDADGGGEGTQDVPGRRQRLLRRHGSRGSGLERMRGRLERMQIPGIDDAHQ